MTSLVKKKTAYTNVRLLDPESGTDVQTGSEGGLLIEGDHILDVGAGIFTGGLLEDVSLVDCGGLSLAPGLIDIRVMLGEPGFENRETIVTAGQAAAVGGVTTMVASPESDPCIDNPVVLKYVQQRSAVDSLVNVRVVAAATKKLQGNQLTEIGMLSEAGAVGFSDGHTPIVNAQIMARVLSYAKGCGALIIQQALEPSLSKGVMNLGHLSTRMGLKGCSPMAEVIMLERDLRLVAMTGGTYHATGISTAESVRVSVEGKRARIKRHLFHCAPSLLFK